jgi:radical SAM superfamily enzyme YgiQ (UPF0313 family)
VPSILLVTPGRRWKAGAHIRAVVKSAVAPADLTTIAALTPDGYEVDIWDEALRGRIRPDTRLPRRYDLAGIGGYTSDQGRTTELGDEFRRRGIPAVVGGVGVSSEPERYRAHFDVLFIGEAEYTWPRFLADFEAGRHQPEYRQVKRVRVSDSPPPRWDKIAGDLHHYAWTVVQTTRGCPFDCEFCDVVSLFGRQPRHKTNEQVLVEIRTLGAMGAVGIMLADDNVYGDKRYYKNLLREIATLNRSFRHPLKFWGQVSLNVANDEEMLALLSEANVSSLLIGIETPNVESLVETNKPQNYRLDMLEALKKIQSFGLKIEASLVVGFDHDDATIFQQQYDFIQQACLHPVSIWTLTAMTGTKLWTRLQRENRLLARPPLEKLADLNAGLSITNVIPKSMTSEELLLGYRDLLVRVHDWDAFEARIEGLIARVERFPPLMLEVPDLSRQAMLKFFLVNLFDGEGRRDLWRRLTDQRAAETKLRLMKRVVGDREREVFLRRLIGNAIDEQHNFLAYVLPSILREVDAELERLAREGMVRQHFAAPSVPESFRQPYNAVFPSVHERIRSALRDDARTEAALVEVFGDFLARWGSGFERFDEHLRIQLGEICDRAIARENGDKRLGPESRRGWDPGAAVCTNRVPDLEQRRLASDVLRCVEDELRR